MDFHPYASRYDVLRSLPEHGTEPDEILGQVAEMAHDEDQSWEQGKCSGTMYCGDHEHYEFLNRVFGLYSHVNAMQRDICPSQTRFESEIIAMTLDLMHGPAVREANPDHTPCGVLGFGGTESIMNAVLAYRERARIERGVTDPELLLPITAHAAFDKAARCFGIRAIHAPIDPKTTQVDLAWLREHVTPDTIALVGSAGNYPYGTIDPIDELSDLALEHGIGLHVDACLGGFILPFGEALGHDIPPFDFRLPGVTSISADTHKYGYALKGTSVLLYRDTALRKLQYFLYPDWPGGTYVSPGLCGSRSGGLIAATWASMVRLGREGYLRHARGIFETAFALQAAVERQPELRLLGRPTFCFAFTSDEFDIYHVNDHMKTNGWRFNGQQYPSALHLCVTRPQVRPGLVEEFEADLAKAVDYAKSPPNPLPQSGALYGGAGARATSEAVDQDRVRAGMIAYQDRTLSLPDQ